MGRLKILWTPSTGEKKSVYKCVWESWMKENACKGKRLAYLSQAFLWFCVENCLRNFAECFPIWAKSVSPKSTWSPQRWRQMLPPTWESKNTQWSCDQQLSCRCKRWCSENSQWRIPFQSREMHEPGTTREYKRSLSSSFRNYSYCTQSVAWR